MKVATLRQAAGFLVTSAVALAFAIVAFPISFQSSVLFACLAGAAFMEGVFPD